MRGSGSGKTNALINLTNKQNNIDKIYLYDRDLSEPKYEYLIKKREDVRIKHLNNPNAIIECSNTMMTFLITFMVLIQTEEQKS